MTERAPKTRPSHPPTLLTLLRRTLVQKKPLAPGESLLIAVSGGPDSIALLHAMSRLAPTFGIAIAAHGIDHGLRDEASSELDRAEAFAATLAVPFSRTKVDLAKGPNVQARAREARRAALIHAADSMAGPATRIATAHHADDRAETVLLRILRGSPLTSLAPLPLTAGRFVRPLVDIPKSAIDLHVARHGLPVSTDPSNRDPRYLRSRVRHELVPLLRSLDPAIERHLNALADDVAKLQLATAKPSLSVADLQNTAENRLSETAFPLSLPPSTPLRARRALAEAIRTEAYDSQVFLPEGLVALYDRQQVQWVLRPRNLSAKRSLELRHRRV